MVPRSAAPTEVLTSAAERRWARSERARHAALNASDHEIALIKQQITAHNRHDRQAREAQKRLRRRASTRPTTGR